MNLEPPPPRLNRFIPSSVHLIYKLYFISLRVVHWFILSHFQSIPTYFRGDLWVDRTPIFLNAKSLSQENELTRILGPNFFLQNFPGTNRLGGTNLSIVFDGFLYIHFLLIFLGKKLVNFNFSLCTVFC